MSRLDTRIHTCSYRLGGSSKALAFLWIVLGAAVAGWSQESNEVVKISTFWSASGIRPGAQVNLAVVLDIDPRYHVVANTAREPYVPLHVRIENLPEDLRSSTALFPKPQPFRLIDETVPIFSGRTIVYIPIVATSSAKPREQKLDLVVTNQACDDKICLQPATVRRALSLKIVDPPAEVERINAALFTDMNKRSETLRIGFFGWDFDVRTSRLWLLLIVAGLGGFLLNFTPCVLPLIPLKIMGLSRAAGNRQRCFTLGLVMSLGVVAFWLGLAVAISSISGFNATNKLFQYPAFTIGVGVIICVLAIGMCGLFSVRLPQWAYSIDPSQESMGGSFLFGIMTAVLSTPCTAPFMGAAAAWSATQTPAITLSTFVAIGTGMALPYLLLSAFPALVNRMPRAGPASELIKQVMGLLMLAAGAYFLGTGVAALLARPPDPPSQAYWWAVALFIVGAGVWLAWRTNRLASRILQRLLFGALGVALAIIGATIGLRFTQGSPVKWIYYTPERLATIQRQGKVVVIDFTAAWCLNCHALEQGVLHNPKVVALLNSTNVAPIKVDITGNNPAGNSKLIEVGRRTIPYLVVYAPNGEEVFSSDAYTVEQVVTAIEQARIRGGLSKFDSPGNTRQP